MAVGAEYQTVTRYFSMNAYHRPALKPEPRTTCVTPFDQGPMILFGAPQAESVVHFCRHDAA
jgi:hypothetical protein